VGWLCNTTKTIGINTDSVTLQFSKQELELVNNALNEVCNGIDVPEFETRMGCTREELQNLLSEIQKVLES